VHSANCQKKATLEKCPYLLEQALEKCINRHTRHMQAENCIMSIMRVFFNWRLETSNKFDRKAGFSDRDLTNHMPWCRSIHDYEQDQLFFIIFNYIFNNISPR